MALTTTTTSLPRRRVRATWSATARMRSGSATDVPPNFWTSRPTNRHGTSGFARSPTRFARRRVAAFRLVHCPPVAGADKRQRKKDNARAAREAREAQLRRQRQRKTAVRVGALVALFAIVVA